MESGTTSISIGHLGQRQLRWLEQFILAGIIHLQPLAQSLASPEMEKPKHEPSGESSEYLEEVRERWKRDALRRQISGAILPPEVKKRLLKNLSEVMILPPLEPLAEVLDGGRFQIEGRIFNASMSGLYVGRPTLFYFTPGSSQYSLTEFHVALSCRSALSFNIRKVSVVNILGKALGFLTEVVEIGDPVLDRKLIFSCNEAAPLINWMGRPGTRENVASLVLSKGVDKLQLQEGFLEIILKSSFEIHLVIPVFCVGLREKMRPASVRGLLQKLETLSQSLESI